MKYFGQFVFALLVLLLVGCSQETEPTPEASQTPAPPPLNITYCDINPSDLCLKGFDLNDEGQTLIFFLADDYSFADIYVQAEKDGEEFTFVCGQSQTTRENVYCLGGVLPDDEASIKLNVYAKTNREQIARGVFVLQYSALPTPDVDFEAIMAGATQTTTPVSTQLVTQTAASKTPLPAYPNPHPNPTAAP